MKRTRLNRRTELRPGGRLRARSARKITQDQARTLMLNTIRLERPYCEGCPRIAAAGYPLPVEAKYPHPWTEAHEPRTRARGGDPTDPNQVVVLCGWSHRWAHAHPQLAERVGLYERTGR